MASAWSPRPKAARSRSTAVTAKSSAIATSKSRKRSKASKATPSSTANSLRSIKTAISHFQLLQNALRHEAKLLYCAFDLMFLNGEDLRGLTLLERKKRLKDILPRHKLIAFSRHRKTSGTKFFEEAERKGLEGIMAKRADSTYHSGSRTDDWLKIKTSKRQEVVIAGFTAPRRTRPFFGALALAVREKDGWRYIGHVGTGFSHETLEELHGKLIKLKTAKSPFSAKVKDEAVTTWVKPSAGCGSQVYRMDQGQAKCGTRFISDLERTSRPRTLCGNRKSRAISHSRLPGIWLR